MKNLILLASMVLSFPIYSMACPGGKAEIVPFQAKYEADIPNPIFFGRLRIPGSRQLQRLGNDQWQMQNKTGYKKIGLKETSEFNLTHAGCLRSQKYEQLHTGPAKKRSFWQEFDWSNMLVNILYKGEKDFFVNYGAPLEA